MTKSNVIPTLAVGGFIAICSQAIAEPSVYTQKDFVNSDSSVELAIFKREMEETKLRLESDIRSLSPIGNYPEYSRTSKLLNDVIGTIEHLEFLQENPLPLLVAFDSDLSSDQILSMPSAKGSETDSGFQCGVDFSISAIVSDTNQTARGFGSAFVADPQAGPFGGRLETFARIAGTEPLEILEEVSDSALINGIPGSTISQASTSLVFDVSTDPDDCEVRATSLFTIFGCFSSLVREIDGYGCNTD